MKLFVFPLLALLGASSLAVAATPSTNPAKSQADAALSQNPSAWSVVGQWQGSQPAWTDTITIAPDGTFSRTQGDAGQWTLTGLQDHLALILAWKDWPAETLTLTTPDDFRGMADEGEFTMRRVSGRTAESRSLPPSATVEIRHWRQGEPPLRLIRKEEGFCALLSVGGGFQGGGEQVRVYIGEDDYWYLGGRSMQEGVEAECLVVRYPAAPSGSAAPSPAPAETVNILAASYSFGSQYADVTARVQDLLQERTVFQANPTWLLADPRPGWNKALVIFCEVRGKQAIFSVGEGENVSRELLLEKARPISNKPSAKSGGSYRVDTRLSTPLSPDNSRHVGVFSDPSGDCSLVQTDREITLTVPGGSVHDLFPVNSSTNAPTVLTPVEGDFMAQVRVSGNFDPGPEPAKDFPRAFHGAGLLVFQDKENYVRLERAEMMWKNDNRHAYWHPLFQQNIDGTYKEFVGPTNLLKPVFKEPATDLRLVRKGSALYAFISRDGGNRWGTAGQFDSLKSKSVQVGISALNTSAQEFKAVFEGLTITPLASAEK